MTVWNYTLPILTGLYFLMVAASVYTVLFERRDPTRAFMWIVVIVVVPVAGLLSFIIFGQNYRKRKMFRQKEAGHLRRKELLSEWQFDNLDTIDSHQVADHINIVKLLLKNNKAPITVNNNISILKNGENTFPSLFAALRKAKHHIHLEYYKVADDTLGGELSEILCAKAQEGVTVRLLFDDVGSWSLPRRYQKKLKSAGVQVKSFLPAIFPFITSSVNYRNHRKIVVVDGEVGFMGGLNIADKYLRGLSFGIWRDTHIRLEGEAVRILQATFLNDWYLATKNEVTLSRAYFPIITKEHTATPCQIAVSGPDSDYAAIMQCFFAAISRAKKYVYISTPYFLPSETLLTALKVAALSGVDIRIILPEKSDTKIVHWASRSYFTEMMEAGIKIHLYNKGFNHSKVMIIDDTFSSVGSANMDMRSFEDNFEITAMIYDETLTNEMKKDFTEDLSNSTHITLEGWNNRKKKDNVKEAAARLFAPLL